MTDQVMRAHLPTLLASIAILVGVTVHRAAAAIDKPAVAIFAGGCFWSMEKAFDETVGVIEAVSGYTGGTVANPPYEDVVGGRTGHLEAVRVEYDPSKITYETLLDVYWHHIDPTDAHGTFCDKGPNYLSAIFYTDSVQKAVAGASKVALERSGRFSRPIVTKIRAAAPFYAAEAYHQDYAKRNPDRYMAYRIGCRRDARLKALWGDEAPK